MKKISIFFGIGLAFLLSFCNPAWAHAYPKEYSPKPDAVVHNVKTVSIVFGEELEPAFSTITLLDADKQKMATGTVDHANPKKMILEFPSLKKGKYHVKWVAVARDGHKTHGEYEFKVK